MSKIVLGIDPGSLKTGWGVVSMDGRTITATGWGVVKMKSSQPLLERLTIIHEGLCQVLDTYRPDAAAIEGIFQHGSNKNYASTLKLGHARGAALLAVGHRGVSLEEYAPAEVKKTLTGRGRADKHQVTEMIRAMLKIDEKLPEDAADALAIAMCHAFRLRNPLPRGIR